MKHKDVIALKVYRYILKHQPVDSKLILKNVKGARSGKIFGALDRLQNKGLIHRHFATSIYTAYSPYRKRRMHQYGY